MKVTGRPVIDRIASAPYRQTAKAEPFKPGDEVQFRHTTLRGHGWFLGQIWCWGPRDHEYWIALPRGEYALVHRSELRLVCARGTESDFIVEVA